MLGSADERTQRATRKIGRVLGEKWRLDRLIGMGGMAAVYAATHTNNQRQAAIKVLHREFSAKDDLRKRFLREGYIANKVGHPGAITILDDGADEDGSVFLVMELFHGDTLHELARASGGTLPPLEVLKVVDNLLDVLASAHQAGVVHRDLKPENIFVTQHGDVKVLDFGIARLLDTTGEMTTLAGVLVGTPTYMPPEQVAGKIELIDGRTDLWSVGAMMFTLLSGKLVHEATTQNALLLAAMTCPARKLVEVIPDVNPLVARAVDGALEFDRDNRWPDARAMQAAVRDAIATGAARAGAPKTGIDLEQYTPRLSSYGRRSFAVIIAALLLGVVAGLAAWAQRKRPFVLHALRERNFGSGAVDAGSSVADAEAEDAAAVGSATEPTDAGADEEEDDDAGDDAGDDEYEDDDAGDDEEDAVDAAAATQVAPGYRGPKSSVSAPHRFPIKKPPAHKPPAKRRKRRPRPVHRP